MFQDLFNGKFEGIGKKKNGFYLFITSTTSDTTNWVVMTDIAIRNSVTLHIDLCHKRLGYFSTNVLKKLLPISSDVIFDKVNKSEICCCAKQIRIPFPSSFIKTFACFDLVHKDLWGLTKSLHLNGINTF